MHRYKKKTIKALIVILILVSLFFMLTVVSQMANKAVFNIGIEYWMINYIVMFLCFLAIAKVIFEIVKIERKN